MTNYISKFKNTSFEYRKTISENVMKKYPDRVCVIVERDPGSKTIPEITKHKYLVPKTATVGTFANILRSKIKLPEYESFYITFNGYMVARHIIMSEAYRNYSEEDGFLYCRYCSEKTYG